MAGRGTDIKLGEGVVDFGGLKIIGTERHEARRIDNQLRGRSGRQGDPGESRFYLSLEDELMRLFGAEKVMKLVDKMGMDDEPIEHSFLSKAIESAQKKVEGNNFGIRKHLLDYDQVMNEQREIIYRERNKVLKGEDLKDQMLNIIKNVVESGVDQNISEEETAEEKVNLKGLREFFFHMLQGDTTILNITREKQAELNKSEFKQTLLECITQKYHAKEVELTPEKMREIERVILLKVIDQLWTNHIDSMDQMRQGISLRSYAQRDPLVEYKFLSYEMFEELTTNIQLDTIKNLLNVRLAAPIQREQVKGMATNKDESAAKKPIKRSTPKIGRNDPCHCGSGLKYKFCHGKNA